MKITIRDEVCHFLKENAVYWEREKILFLADIHLGKAAAFRASGVFVPEGTMEKDLSNILQLIQKYKPLKCIIVGDLIHASLSWTEDVKNTIEDWLKKCDCEVHLILGNHDRSLLKNLKPSWPITIHQEFLIEPFLFSHYPKESLPWFVWAGHIHPKIEIKSGYDRIVLRCFQVFENYAILPAFSYFVGGAYVTKSATSRIFAITDQAVREI